MVLGVYVTVYLWWQHAWMGGDLPVRGGEGELRVASAGSGELRGEEHGEQQHDL